jgi:SAM-dependent methyltransferase
VATSPVYDRHGWCPICETPARFSSREAWFRDHLLCGTCGSIPRERALALLLKRRLPGWAGLRIHESSPAQRGISAQIRRRAAAYVPTPFFPHAPAGRIVNGFRNENLEAQTFADGSFDLVVSLDVLEHVNEPDRALREICRTLVPGGAHVFTVPTYKGRTTSERRARFLPDGRVEHLAEPEYHGNPVDESGSLVTFHYGYDLATLVTEWTGMHCEVTRFHDPGHGIIGEFTEVYWTTKPA